MSKNKSIQNAPSKIVWEHRCKELYVSGLMKNGVSETDAWKRAESVWSGDYYRDDNYYVIADRNRKLILRKVDENGNIVWHPYIEKAMVFPSNNDALEFMRGIDWGKNGFDMSGLVNGYPPVNVLVGCVREMTEGVKTWLGNIEYFPFRAQTGIKNKIGYSSSQG